MQFKEFLVKRADEIAYLYANGFNNGDASTNGEYKLLEQLKAAFGLFIDIGANMGDFSKRIVDFKDNKSVICFEPNPSLNAKLFQILGDNEKIYSVALADKKAMKQALNIHPNDSTVSSLFKRTEMMPRFNQEMGVVEVDVSILDEYYEEIESKARNLGSFIKIDAEGMEYRIMKGSERVFKMSYPLFVMFEYSYGWKESGSTLRNAFHLLDDLGFTIFRVTPFGLEREKFFSHDMESFTYCNYLGVKNFNIRTAFKSPVLVASKNGDTDFFPFDK